MESSIPEPSHRKAARIPEMLVFSDDVTRAEISATGRTWASWFESAEVSADFMNQRDQPAQQPRDPR